MRDYMKCYNGCPDKTLQAAIDADRVLDKELKEFGARAVFYPKEGKWMVWQGYDCLTHFHSSKVEAAKAAIETLNKKELKHG